MDAKTTHIVQRIGEIQRELEQLGQGSHLRGESVLVPRQWIEGTQRELEQIKRLLLAHEKEPRVSLYGLWAGANISDEDIEEAKRSWHKEVEALDR